MRYIEETTDFQLKNSVVTLGKFDGLHVGHQKLLHAVLEKKSEGYQSVMFTFSLHPYNLFSEKEVQLIYTNEEKLEKLRKEGLDVLIAYPFTKETATLEPEEFIKKVLVEKVDAKVIIVGEDFGFGKNRRGNVEMLKAYATTYGYEVFSYEKVEYKGEEVSSTRVRSELAKGNMEDVNAMLHEPFSIRGTVIHGRKLGRSLGMPTCNVLPAVSKLLPPNGVYVSKVQVEGVFYEAVTNIGLKPTVGGEERPGVETYLFDFEGNLYEKEIEVFLYEHVRPEMKFGSLEELKAQMHRDMEFVKTYFAKIEC